MIFYQGIEGSYSSYVASLVAKSLGIEQKPQGVFSFKDVFENVAKS